MEGIFMGKIVGSVSSMPDDETRNVQIYFSGAESNACSKLSHYNKTYSLVLSDDVIATNDELLKLNEAKAKVADLEKKLAAAKSNENYWRDRKEEEEDHHHYWLHTFDRAVKQAAEKDIHIGVRGTDEDCNAGIVTIDNMKAEELEKQVAQMEDANQKLRQRISEADERIEDLESQVKATTFANDTLDSFSSALTNDYNSLKAEKEDLYNQNQTLGFELSKQKSATEYWRNTYYEIVEKVQDFGVSVDYVGCDSDNNCALLHITNHNNQKWQAMLNALKAKSIEVIYMGEEDGKPIVDVKIPGWEMDKQWVKRFSKRCADLRADKFGLESERDELKEQCDILRKDGVLKGQQCLELKADLNGLKKEYGRVLSEFALCRKQAEEDHKKLEELKSKKVTACTVDVGADGQWKFIYTYMDGHNEPAHINCLCKNYLDPENISCGTIPKCSSCDNYVRGSRSVDVFCHKPVSKEGPGIVRRLSTEESEGPACSDFKARKE